jgi:cytochrome b6-f complex iron-sulfur subunit
MGRVIRPQAVAPGALPRRRLLRSGFAAAASLAVAGVAGAVLPFLRVTRVSGFGTPIEVGTRAELLARFAATDDRPILDVPGRFWLLHAPGGVIAAYRKCTHLGCAVPWDAGNDRFTCPCHGSQFDKRTAIVLQTPAPKPLQLFHISESDSGTLVVDTNPLRVIDRPDNRWDPAHLEIRL